MASEINTGKPMVEVKAGMVKQLPTMTDSEKDYAKSLIYKYIINEGKTTDMLLMRREDNYITIFRSSDSENAEAFANGIFEFLDTDEYLNAESDIKLVDLPGNYVEIWFGDKFYALFNAEGLIVEV